MRREGQGSLLRNVGKYEVLCPIVTKTPRELIIHGASLSPENWDLERLAQVQAVRDGKHNPYDGRVAAM